MPWIQATVEKVFRPIFNWKQQQKTVKRILEFVELFSCRFSFFSSVKSLENNNLKKDQLVTDREIDVTFWRESFSYLFVFAQVRA